MSRVYLNGAFVDKLDARISVYDHGLLYGDGVWEGIRLFNREVFLLDEHVELLIDAASTVGLALPWTAEELARVIRAAVAANARQYGYIRVIVTRGAGTIGLDPRKCDPQLIVLVEEVVPFPAELYGHGVHAITAQSVRLDRSNPLHRIRSLSHGHMAMAKAEALRAGCLEAVLLTTDDRIASSTEGHVFIVKDSRICTPMAEDAFPRDAWRNAVMEWSVVEEARLSRTDLIAADEAFLAGASGGVIGIVQLDGKRIGSGREGEVTRSLRLRSRDRVS